MRYHKIAESPKRVEPGDEERHRYSEIDVVNEALRELLSQLYNDRNGYLDKDKAHVAVKILYRLEEHHKQARDGRPHYPPFSWEIVGRFAETPPFTYQEYSTPIVAQNMGHVRGGPGHGDAGSNSSKIPAPATPQEEA